MKIKRNIRFWLSLIGLGYVMTACSTEVKYQPVSGQLVVEGWIENGESPVVIVTQLMPLGVVIDSFDLWNLPIRWANVTVNDGERDYTLTGRPNDAYMAGYVYTTNDLKGETGKTYTLKVSYEGRIITAQTAILPPVSWGTIQVSSLPTVDTLCQVSASIIDPINSKNYYLIRVRQGNESFCPAMGGALEDDILSDPQTRIPIYRAVKIKNNESLSNKTPFFTIREPVELRLCNMAQSSFVYWEQFMNLAINVGNPLYPSVQQLHGNIQGGLGIWYGAGISTVFVNIPDSLPK